MNKEICCNWSDLRRGCEALHEKCSGYERKDGKPCHFYKTQEQKVIDNKRTKKRLKELGMDKKTTAYEEVEFRKKKYGEENEQ